MATRDPAAEQLSQYKDKAKLTNEKNYATSAGGVPLVNKDCSLTVGRYGPILLHDVQYVEELAHFVRERIPERVLHAKGAGAFGFFEVTSSTISEYTSAKLFTDIGKKTPIIVRFSTTAGELGSAEAVRDPKGMSVKFQTEDGIFDLIGNNQPVFFLRDPVLFPSLVHAVKRNPKTHLPDSDMFWDFFSLRPETTHQILHLFSAKGIPDGWRRINCYPANIFRLVKDDSYIYCKFTFLSNQEGKYLSEADAATVSPDHYTKDLYDAIEKNTYPSWTLNVQVMNERQVRKMMHGSFNPFDVTMYWPKERFPYLQVGKLVLERNPTNYFAEIEQLAFSPGNLVPGIEPSAYDRILHGRIFAYPDAQRYRLGANFQQLGANRSLHDVKNFQRDGGYTFFYQGEDPTYHPNSFGGPDCLNLLTHRTKLNGDAEIGRFSLVGDDFKQPRDVFESMSSIEHQILAKNLASSLAGTSHIIRDRALQNFLKVHSKLYADIHKLMSK